ncbi:DUF1642 domain-containing protein [Tetragenococcus halophilus]|uniref:DUF1642 domain-containing protein n=1 Tax=Tetragenococcus halophilus TaxID=51669 RepID=UPI002A98B5F3|nr:DUF1642 domain-containing protein [Tetragenococcus halophilus]
MDKQELILNLEQEVRLSMKDDEMSDLAKNWYKAGLNCAIDRMFSLESDEPEKPEIPKFVAKEIPSAPREALDCYYNPGAYIIPPYSYKVITWIEGHFDIFLQALVNGFEIQKEPAWVVKASGSYVTSIDYDFYDWTIGTTINKDDESILTFTDKQKAEAVATLVDGTVKEWSEKDEQCR